MPGKKRMIAVPLIALMVCTVACIGVAYAYNAAMTVPSKNPDAGDLTIDLANGNPSTDIVVAAGNSVVFTDNYSYSALVGFTKTNRVDAYAKEGKISFALKVTGEATAAKLQVKSDDIATYLANELGNSVTVGDLFTVKVNTTDSTTEAIDLSSSNAEFAITKAADAELDVTVYLFIIPKDSNAHTVQEATATTAQGYKYAANFVTAFEALSFTMTFAADSDAIEP